MADKIKSVQTYGRKKTATAVAHCKAGLGLIKVNGRPLEHMEPQILRLKLQVGPFQSVFQVTFPFALAQL